MPGAPWRSHGCNTCRKRKVKCDLQRPECARCLRGGHHCQGYGRAAKFVHTFSESNDGSQVLETEKIPPNNPSYAPSPRDSVPTISSINVNAQIRSQLFSIFIDSYIPSSSPSQISFRCQRSSKLIGSFPSLTDTPKSQLLDRAIAALASVFVGKRFNDINMLNNGVRVYNQAIRTFAQLISRRELPVKEVLCANLIFQLYEIINCTSGFSGWMAHMEGANAVLARHHQNLAGDDISKMLLRHLKLANIFHAIGKSKSALASCPMWQMITPIEENNDLTDEIINILMHCTVLIELVGNAHSDPDIQKLKRLCWKLERQTASWYQRLKSISREPLYTTMPDNTESNLDRESKQTFPDRYHFIALEVAEAHSLYWAAQLIIYSLSSGLEIKRKSFTQHETTLTESSSLNTKIGGDIYLKNAEFYADQICRGVAYLIQPEMHILGGENLLFPVSMAAQFFHQNGHHDKYQWCQEVFVELESVGLGLSHVLQGTPWSEYRYGEANAL